MEMEQQLFQMAAADLKKLQSDTTYKTVDHDAALSAFHEPVLLLGKMF